MRYQNFTKSIHVILINKVEKCCSNPTSSLPHPRGSHWSTNLIMICAAVAKSLQSCPTLCDPIDGSPPGSPVLGILQARTLEWVAISFSNAWKWKVKVKTLSCLNTGFELPLCKVWCAHLNKLPGWFTGEKRCLSVCSISCYFNYCVNFIMLIVY